VKENLRLGRTVGGDGRALVMDDDRLVGIVAPVDVVRMSETAMLRAGT
jgi:hypothetical protein